MTTSTDPNVTSGSANKSGASLSFPLNENLVHTTRLRFVKYSRFAPNSNASEDTTTLITLPLPLSIPDNYSIRSSGTYDQGVWGMIDLNNIEKAKSYASLAKEALDTGISSITDSITRMDQQFKSNALKALALSPVMLNGDARSNLQIAAGVVQNPHTTLLFDGVNLKTFTLTWRMSPRSEQESEALRKIINEIKIRSHPEESFEGYALDYPDLVYVTYAGDSTEYLPKHHKAMVTNIMVNYGGGNGLVFYRNGSPIEVEIAISFMEAKIITRNVLRDEDGLGEVVT